MLRFSVHLGLLFDYGVRSRSNFDLWHMLSSFQTLLRRMPLPRCVAWDAVADPVATVMKVMLGSLLCPTGLSMCLSSCQTSLL